jgi:hypothetical protein
VADVRSTENSALILEPGAEPRTNGRRTRRVSTWSPSTQPHRVLHAPERRPATSVVRLVCPSGPCDASSQPRPTSRGASTFSRVACCAPCRAWPNLDRPSSTSPPVSASRAGAPSRGRSPAIRGKRPRPTDIASRRPPRSPDQLEGDRRPSKFGSAIGPREIDRVRRDRIDHPTSWKS